MSYHQESWSLTGSPYSRNLRKIPEGVLNCLAKTTSRKPSLQYKRVDNVSSDHADALLKVGLATSVYPTIEVLCKGQDKKKDLDKENYPDVNKNKN